jgi:organic hydroperoxide reductase OsmC/OhrA
VEDGTSAWAGAMTERHQYQVSVRWTGNRGSGTSGYRDYDRNHLIEAPLKPPLSGSSDPKFHGDRTRYNPEELLVAILSACHMLWYLHLCADSGIVVQTYLDRAEGAMETGSSGAGRFTTVTLRPEVTISRGDAERAKALHREAHEKCYIANSVNFPVRVEATLNVTS